MSTGCIIEIVTEATSSERFVMANKITKEARDELARAVRRRYRDATTREEKSRMLSEFVAVTGYHPKSAVRVLSSDTTPETRPKQTRSRHRLYDEAARQALIVLWEASDRVWNGQTGQTLHFALARMRQLSACTWTARFD